MGDDIADLPEESDLPPLPPKTYQWEDIRRQKQEGRYPWTHLYKGPFDDKKWEEEKEHEYEPVIPMDVHKTPPPVVKITLENEHTSHNFPTAQRTINGESSEINSDKHHLLVPQKHEYDDADDDENDSDSDDPSEEITAEELQQRLEEKYFRQPSPVSCNSATKHDYQPTEMRRPSPALTDNRPPTSCRSCDTPKLTHKMHLQADKLRRKFSNFKEHISKEYADCSPHAKRKASDDDDNGCQAAAVAATLAAAPKETKSKTRRQPKKNKFNFRRHNAKAASAPNRSKLPSEPDLRGCDGQQADADEHGSSRFSFRSLRSLRRSPSSSSSSVKGERERKRSLSCESSASKKKFDFHFGTYPRIFGRRSKKVANGDKHAEEHVDDTSVTSITSATSNSKPKSVPGTPMPRRSPLSKRWMRKLTAERKKQSSAKCKNGQPQTTTCHTKGEKEDGDDAAVDAVVQQSIRISLHAEAKPTEAVMKMDTQQAAAPEATRPKTPNTPSGIPPTPPETTPPTKLKIDNKNFIFVSLHEERFPEKLRTPECEPKFTEEELEMERDLKKAHTARKFHHMLRRLEADRKLRNRRAAADRDDQPQPVIITEITTDDDDGFRSAEYAENNIETPEEDQEVVGKFGAECVPPEKVQACDKPDDKEQRLDKGDEWSFKASGIIDIGQKAGWDMPKFGSDTHSAVIEKHEYPSTNDGLEVEVAVAETPSHIESSVRVTPIERTAMAVNRQKVENEADRRATVIPEAVPRDECCATVPQKIPRKKPKTFDSERESKESLSAFEDSTFVDAIVLDVATRKSYTKTYIKDSLDEIPSGAQPTEPAEQLARRYREYEKALEKSKAYASIESENYSYSAHNTLARLETPVPPFRPNRSKGTTLLRGKRNVKSATAAHRHDESVYDLEANQSYNTFPMARQPDKPRRRLRKRRTYSNSTNNTENTDMKSIGELEDDTINQNIVNSKQLSVSFLPLTSDVVGEPVTEYNLRETSSMIHLNLNDPPLPPKRRKGQTPNGNDHKYNTLPNRRYVSKTTLSVSEAYNMDLNIDGEIDYADDVNSTIPDSDSPPKRPSRKRSTGPSTVDEDRTSRGIESISSEKSSSKEDIDFGDDGDSKDVHGYAVIGKPTAPRLSHTRSEGRNSQGTASRKSRRFSDFFTFPRIRAPTNYVPVSTQTLNRRRLPSPSRPPRRSRPEREERLTSKSYVDTNCTVTVQQQHQHQHQLPDPQPINFDEEEQLNFNLATSEDEYDDNDDDVAVDRPEDSGKNLQTEDILEKMKTRPLPPPPRPTRKPKEDGKNEHYSQSAKKKVTTCTNDLGHTITCVEEKIINTTTTVGTLTGQRTEIESKNWLMNECSNSNTRFENRHQTSDVERVTKTDLQLENAVTTETASIRGASSSTIWQPIFNIANPHVRSNVTNNLSRSEENSNQTPLSDATPSYRTDEANTGQNLLDNATKSTSTDDKSHPHPFSSANKSPKNSKENLITPPQGENLNLISASKLQISELNVAKLSVGEIESSRWVTSTVDSSRVQVSSIQSDSGNLVLNSIELTSPTPSSASLPCSLETSLGLEMAAHRDVTPSSDDAASTDMQPAKQRPRISSMITEVGSDNDESSSKVTKVVRPNRKKQTQRRSAEPSCSSSQADGAGNPPSLTGLMYQILQICHSSVGQAMHSLLEQIIPEDREKRNEVQAAIWVITIIVAGCLMLGLQSNEKIVHHHHWDFHFPPPH